AQAVQVFMGPRYDEGYIKGVHDHDAALILKALLTLEPGIGLLRYSTQARSLAWAFWHLADLTDRDLFTAKISGMGQAHSLFGADKALGSYLEELRDSLWQFIQDTPLFAENLVAESAEYLFHQLAESADFVTDKTVLGLKQDFEQHLKSNKFDTAFSQSTQDLKSSPVTCLRLIRDW
ncbi:MAG: hypothetical protein GY809_31360, partial [Planctomycetes bacterium]|nr:hypothetical protein [Planctomycetota bacterium]